MGREGKGRGNGGEEEENMDRLGSGKSGFLSLYRSVRLFCGFVLLNNSKLASFDLCLSFQRSLARRASFFFFLLLFFVSFFLQLLLLLLFFFVMLFLFICAAFSCFLWLPFVCLSRKLTF